MEQQRENHMRLPPPVTTNGNGGISNIRASASSPMHTSSSHQPINPTQMAPAHSIPILSPPFTHANSPYYGASAPQHTPSSSSLSPRPLGPVPAYSPPSYAFSQQSHDPSTLNFPDAPSTELAPLQLNAQNDHNVGSLPPLASLTGASTASARRFGPAPATGDSPYSPPTRGRGWPVGNPYSAYYTPGYGQSADSPARMDVDNMSSGTRGPLSPDLMGGRASSVSLDDPDVRMAAEALGDLKADFVSSPQVKSTPMPTSPRNNFGTPGPREAEPLLSLVMTSGSLLAKPIGGTVSAYNTTKNFSPGFIKTPVEYVEGVVGSGLHLSGIEGGVRWFFRGKGRHPSSSDLEAGENSHKRRRVDSRGGSAASTSRRDAAGVAPLTAANGMEVDPYGFAAKDRRLSMSTVDTLPAYDDARSPEYTEDATSAPHEKEQTTPTAADSPSATPAHWQSRLIMSTSGLSIAMSEESLRSLKYCLRWLRWANEHIGGVIALLQDALDKYESQRPRDEEAMADAGEEGDQARQALSVRVSELRSDILKTLQGVIETVSTYAGGALPENARALVKRHLTSLPQRFWLATRESNGGAAASSGSPGPSTAEEGKEKEVREGAHKVLVLAKEGLDMMAQVSGVLNGTIVSAEEWCERLGRKKREERQQSQGQEQGEASRQAPSTVPFAGVGVDGDVKMG